MLIDSADYESRVFEDLAAWNKARGLVNWICAVTRGVEFSAGFGDLRYPGVSVQIAQNEDNSMLSDFRITENLSQKEGI